MCTNPNIPKPRPLLKHPKRILRPSLLLNLTSPNAPADGLQFLGAKDDACREEEEADEGFESDVEREGGEVVAEEGGVFVGRIATVW